jgi:hypothetical protein
MLPEPIAARVAALGVALLLVAPLCLAPLPARAQSASVPLSFEDPAFDGVTPMSDAPNLPPGTVLSDKSIVVDGEPATLGSGSFTLNRVRIRSSEAIRAAGGDVTLNWVWAEAEGGPGDHADALQCYGPGSTGLISVFNTTFRAHEQNATAGYFAADDWRGTHRLNNVLFWGGPVGLRLNRDGGAGVYLRDVYFVKDSFVFAPFQIHIPILQWENVRWVSIVNGQLVMGEAIPQPE